MTLFSKIIPPELKEISTALFKPSPYMPSCIWLSLTFPALTPLCVYMYTYTYIYTLCLKKSSHLLTLCNFTNFQNFCIAGKRMKFATKVIRHYPPHLRYGATLPREIKNSNFCRYSADMEENTNNFFETQCIYVYRAYCVADNGRRNTVNVTDLLSVSTVTDSATVFTGLSS